VVRIFKNCRRAGAELIQEHIFAYPICESRELLTFFEKSEGGGFVLPLPDEIGRMNE